MKCETTTCEGEQGWRYTWPGRPEMFVCVRCAARASGVAEAMGFDLEVRRVTVVLCERHQVEGVQLWRKLEASETLDTRQAAGVALLALDREIAQCQDCKRL
jgi:hypothetical protein